MNITIPVNVKSIGYRAFGSCYSLVSINVERPNPKYFSINGVLFSLNQDRLICYPAGKNEEYYGIPNTVAFVEDYAFEDCRNLMHITTSKKVTSIGDSAFLNCSNLTTVGINENVTSIGSQVFSCCPRLENVVVLSLTCKFEWSDLDSHVTIYGFASSAAKQFAQSHGNTFVDYYCTDCDMKHTYSKTVLKKPTCKEIGEVKYTCERCYQSYTETIPALGGQHEYKSNIVTQPTCTAKGVTRYTCSRCGDSYDEENIDALGHSYAKTIIGPTCTTQGYTAYVCTVCGEEERRDKTPALGHQYKSQLTKATTAKDGQSYKKCTVCGAVTGKTVIAKASNIKLNKTAYTYNGKVQRPGVTVKNSKGKALKNGTDYKISYPKGMKNVGKYTVKVTLKGNYSGSKSMTYNINPKGTSVSKVTAAKKGFKVTWKKQATQTTGYQVQYSISSKFKKAKTVTISKNKTTSKSVSKLSAKKKYYVRVRTYKTVKIGGKSVKLYSGWSKAKSVTTKK